MRSDCRGAPRGSVYSTDNWISNIDAKKRFFTFTFFILVAFFTFCNVFFYFPNVFLFYILLKNVGKVQSGKQINKKHFRNNSNEIDL